MVTTYTRAAAKLSLTGRFHNLFRNVFMALGDVYDSALGAIMEAHVRASIGIAFNHFDR